LSPSQRYGPVVVALAAGALLGLAGPPANLYPAFWVGMAALAYVLEGGGRGRWLDGAGRGLAFGTGANLVLTRFVPPVLVRFTSLGFAAGVVALLLISVLQGLAWAVAAVVRVQLGRGGVPSWVAFGVGVYAGTFVPAVFLWTPAGLVTPLPEMIQLAEVVGDRGVTLLMALSAGLLASAASGHAGGIPPRRPGVRGSWLRSALFLGAGLGLPLLTFAEGKARIARVERDRADAPTVRIGLVQPSTDAVARWDSTLGPEILARLTSLTQASESEAAELTIWPESAYPYPYSHSSRKCPVGAKAILGTGVRGPVLTGFLMLGHGEQFNSSAICTPDGSLTVPEDKIRLLAFGETIPVIGRIPWVRRTFRRGTGLVPGQRNVVQAWGPIRASVLTCVEDTLSDGGREAMADRPNLLVNLTNDAWFAGTRESELHLRLAVIRAVESRRDMIRAVNLGPTSWVDAAGVVRARYDSALAGVLQVTPALLEWRLTPFDRFGDFPTAALLVLVSLAHIVRARGRKGGRLNP